MGLIAMLQRPQGHPIDSDDMRWSELRVLRNFGLLHGVVQGRRFAHNPRQPNALAILSTAAAKMMDAADGRPAGEIARQLARNEQERKALLASLPMLLRNGFVQSSQPNGVQNGNSEVPRRFDLWVHVTNACNLRCPYCYIHKSADHLEQSAAQRILDTIEATAQAGHYDVIHARYAGGEPMLRLDAMRDFHAEAVRRCQRHGARFTAAVLSNGTALPDGAITWLKQNQIGLSISIDGTDETQDKMRPTTSGRGSFHLLQGCLDRYMEADLRPFILVTVGPDNLANIEHLTRFLLQRGLPFRYSLIRDMTWGAQAFSPHGTLTGDALAQVNATFSRCYNLIEQDMLARIERREMPTPSFRASHRFCDLSPWRPIRKACGAGERFLALGHDGAVSPCQAALHQSAAQVSGHDLDALAAAHKPFGEFRRDQTNDACSRCRHAPSCAGGCPLLLHRRDEHINGQSPYCEVFRHVLPRIVAIAALELMGHARLRETATGASGE